MSHGEEVLVQEVDVMLALFLIVVCLVEEILFVSMVVEVPFHQCHITVLITVLKRTGHLVNVS